MLLEMVVIDTKTVVIEVINGDCRDGDDSSNGNGRCEYFLGLNKGSL